MTHLPLRRDVVIAGSGFGGLSAAILLAKLGLRVSLVESAAACGGALRSYKRRGIDCPVGVHYFGAAGPNELLGQTLTLLDVREAADLQRIGASGVIDRYCFEEGQFDLPPDLETLAATWRAQWPEHREAVEFVVDALAQSMSNLRIDGHGNVARGATALGGIGKSAADLLDEIGCPEQLRRLLDMQAFWTGTPNSECPASFPFMTIGSLLLSAWRLGCTGAQFADALVERARQLGVEVIAGDGADSILTDGNKATGIRLQSGSTIEADFTIAAFHPKHLLPMLPAAALDEDYRNRVLSLKETFGVFGVAALLEAERHPAFDWNLFNVRGSEERSVFVTLQASEEPGWNRLIVLSRSDYDDWQRWHDTTTRRRGSEYAQRKEQECQRVLSRVAEVLGPLHEPRILDTWTPLTLRDWVGAPEGGAYGRRHSVHDSLHMQVMTRAPLPRLLLVGQNAMAPGLLGVAMAMLRVIQDVAGRRHVRGFFVEQLHPPGAVH